MMAAKDGMKIMSAKVSCDSSYDMCFKYFIQVAVSCTNSEINTYIFSCKNSIALVGK